MRKSSTARKAGSNFEACAAEFLSMATGTEIVRRVRHGAKDTGDLHGIRIGRHRVVAECKDYTSRERMASWLAEADAERGNDDALVGVVISHMRGVSADRRSLSRMAAQPVTMTLLDLAALIVGDRIEVIENIKAYEAGREGEPDEQ